MDGFTYGRTKFPPTIIYVLICGFLTAISFWVSYHGIADWSFRTQRGFWNLMGFFSLFFTMGSVLLWFLKKRIIRGKQREPGSLVWVNGSTIKGLREAHVTLGWLAFTFGLGHSAFYLVNLPSRMNNVFSGIVALAGMILVLLTGIMYRHKIISMKTCRMSHRVISCIFGLLILAHI
ncbi:hypothetical protein [Desulfosporosinus sp. FKB]|uniref:hypothetical protein n=1 Tax=Desulfosporosinus sp. FKB TaxID=1969835 RepID=UPI000B49C767|nr:hypothetical protein [Desulfosporosinus sp. FKB]